MTREIRLVRQVAAAVALVVAAAGCGNKHYLNQYTFQDRTIALEYLEPPSPELLQGNYDISLLKDKPLEVVAQVGGGVAKEVVARRASARLDSAAARVNVADSLAVLTLMRSSRYLGTHPAQVADSADFILEVRMKSFGLDARSATATYLYTSAEAVLIDRRSGREIWSSSVSGRERMTPRVRGTGTVPSSIINAGTLATVSVRDFQEGLQELVAFTSQLITDDLRSGLREARDR